MPSVLSRLSPLFRSSAQPVAQAPSVLDEPASDIAASGAGGSAASSVVPKTVLNQPAPQPDPDVQQAIEAKLLAQKSDFPVLLNQLLEEQPNFHAIYKGATATVVEKECCNWAIDSDILAWIISHVGPEASTLETGCGYSSVAFSLASRHHTVISPIAAEHQAIQRWCQNHALDLSHVNFRAEQSQDLIHSLEQTPLDVVLIDGNHAFPTPFIDWYYTAERVKLGGYMLVDDTQLITGKILRDFLASESGRWVLEADLGQTAVFRRVSAESVTRGFWWGLQPYCEQPVA